MKRIFEWIGGFALIAFSFYFTDQVSLLVADKSDLMMEIKRVSAEYEEEPTEAQIDKKRNTIVPGRFGKKVDSKESYLNMHDFGSFNENYLVYEYIKPKISLEDNKDKYITSGNSSHRTISFVLEQNSELEEYLTTQKIKYDIILKSPTDNKLSAEIINGAQDQENFKKIHKDISKSSHICIKQYSNETMCKENDYFIIYPNLELQNSNALEIKNSIKPGSIILVSSNCSLDNLKYILNEINYKDLQSVYISELINERT